MPCNSSICKTNNRYMRNYNKDKNHHSLIIVMQTIFTDGHFLKNYLLTIFNGKDTWKFDKIFIKYYDENCDKGYVFQVDVEYHKELQKLRHNLSFLLERMKIKKCRGNSVRKLVYNLYDKEKYVAHLRTLKKSMDY